MIKIKLLAITVLAILLMPACNNKSESGTKWETTTIEWQDITNVVTSTGTVEPITQVEVGTQVSGIVKTIYTDYNCVVKKGDLLAELDQTVLLSELSSKQSAMSKAKSELDYQQKNLARTKVLYEKQLISSYDYETVQYNYEQAKSNYSVSRNDYQKAQTNLGYAKIYSPIDGVVLSRAVEEGQTVAASFSTPTLFTIANDLKKMQVVANVDEADIGNVMKGQRVTFTVDAYPNDEFQGEVIQVRQSPTTTSNVVTYEVMVNAPNPELKLKPGLTANITIYTLEKKNVIALPSKAFKFAPSNATIQPASTNDSVREVWVLTNNKPVQTKVIVGNTNGILTEVTSGLAKGDVVILSETTTVQAASPAKEDTGETSPFMPQHPGSKKK